MRTIVRALVVASAASVPFTLTHTFEDFAYNVHVERFGVSLLPAAFMVSLAYAVQFMAAVLSSHDDRRGHWLNALLGFGWLAAAAVDHLGEALFAFPYRAGPVSKALEVGIVLAGAIWGGLAVAALARDVDRVGLGTYGNANAVQTHRKRSER
jgi:hypothetical protein